MNVKSCIAGALGLALVSCAGTVVELPPASPSIPSTLTVTTPDAGWRVRIERILERQNEIWMLARVHREPGLAAQVIHRAKADVPIALPAKPIRVFVAGKTWAWPNDEPYEFVSTLEEVLRQAGDARVLYSGDGKQ